MPLNLRLLSNYEQAKAIQGVAPLVATGLTFPFRGARRFEMKTYDLVVIGSGTAAQVASARVRRAGRTVAVVDHRPFGGTCALRGCDPKKMLISGAEAIDAARRMQGHGVAGELRINWPELIAFKRTFTDPVPQKQEARYAAQGIDAFHGLVLLRHKFIRTRRAVEARQHGHRGKRLTRASMMRRRTVAIEFGT